MFIVPNIQIATLSPADICYEESLSTLRYAERWVLQVLHQANVCIVYSTRHVLYLFRAKRIQNKAVVNESPTERLVKELKAENVKLLLRLSRLGQEGRKADDETSDRNTSDRNTKKR